MDETDKQGTERRITLLVAAVDQAAVDRLLLAEPALLGVMPAALLAACAGSAESRAVAAERVAHFNALLLDDPGAYPVGDGPIERLWLRCHTGEITLATAESVARESGFVSTLHPAYLRRVSTQCADWVRKGRQRQALEMHALVRAGQGRLQSLARAPLSVRADLALNELELVSRVISQVADGALHRSAIDAGNALVAEAHSAQAADLEGNALHAMGILIINAYLQFSVDASYQTRIDEWRRSGRSAEPMPEAKDALACGADYLRRASALRVGAARGVSLALLASVLEWQFTLAHRMQDGAPGRRHVRNDEAVRVAREALALLENDDHGLQRRVRMLELLRNEHEPFSLSDLHGFLDLEAEALETRLNAFSLETQITLVDLVAPLDIDRALDLTEKALRVYEREPREESLLTLCRMQAGLLHDRMKKDPAWSALAAQGGFRASELAAQLDQLAHDRDGSQDMRANAWIALAYRAAQSDEPAAALPLIEQARRASPAFFARFERALTTFEADVWGAVAGWLVKREEWPDAIAAIAAALDRYLIVRATSKVRDLVAWMKSLVVRTSRPLEVAYALSKNALGLELELGNAMLEELQEVMRNSLASTNGEQYGQDDYLAALHVAKGQRFAAALSRPRTEHTPDRVLVPLLELIEQAEHEVGSAPVVEPKVNEHDLDPRFFAMLVDAFALWDRTELVQGPPLTAEDWKAMAQPPPDKQVLAGALASALRNRLTLTADASEAEAEAGNTAVERLTNLRRRFDHLNEARLAGNTAEPPSALRAKELQGMLDERSVLLDLYIGKSFTEPESVGVYSLLVTRDALRLNVEKTRYSKGFMTFGAGSELRATAMTLRVEQARMGVMRATAGRRVVDRDAGAQLEIDLREFLGATVEAMHALRTQGKDHLCIVPHGPLHYYPLHLLGPIGRALADEWIVTYLPSLQCLRRAEASLQQPRRGERFGALGLGFVNGQPHGLAPLPSSTEELAAVSRVFDTQPLTNQAATEAAFRDALGRYRYVHLSTHGQHDADAPSFQVVYLSPTPDSDGRLYVHELANVDMGGLEILSLSACETALGRFDAGDNLRGLPARCFLSGAQTIITTLWEASAEASKDFFTAFYTRLHAGESKLDAFASAQRQTRQRYPKYADWGAFMFMGDWLQSTHA